MQSRRTVAAGFGTRFLVVFVGLLIVAGVVLIPRHPGTLRNAEQPAPTEEDKPTRIVSLAPNITEILFALGAADRVAGVTRYCNYPEETASKPKVGDMNAKAEAVLAQRPDLVAGHSVMNDTLITQLKNLDIPVFTMDPKTIADTEQAIRDLGKAIGASGVAEKIVKKMETDIASARESRAGSRTVSVLVVIQSSPLWAAGPETFVDEMLEIANATNVAHDARSGFVTFSKELAVSRNPEVIIVGSEADREFFRTAPAWKTTSAARNGRVYIINNDLLVRPGPRLTEGLKQLAECLNRQPATGGS